MTTSTCAARPWELARRIWSRDSRLSAGERAVAWVLLIHDGKGGCWPGRETIAACTGLSRATVQRVLATLAHRGVLTIEYRPGRTSRYRFGLEHEDLNPAHCESAQSESPVAHDEPTPGSARADTQLRASHDQAKEHAQELTQEQASDPPSWPGANAPVPASGGPPGTRRAARKPRGLPAEEQSRFSEWYDAFPLHASRTNAEKAWGQLTAAEREECIAESPAWIKAREGADRNYLPYPAKYLREKRWTDDPPPPRSETTYRHYNNARPRSIFDDLDSDDPELEPLP